MLGCADAVREGLLADGFDVPVIDPVPTTVNFAAALVRSRLSHSKHAYRTAPEEDRGVGYAQGSASELKTRPQPSSGPQQPCRTRR